MYQQHAYNFIKYNLLQPQYLTLNTGLIMNFTTIDVENSSNPIESICQIGLAKYVNGALVQTYESLVLPKYDFNKYCTKIHGITADDVANAPQLPAIYQDLIDFVGDDVLVSFGNFDKRALRSCAADYDLSAPEMRWADARTIIEHSFPDFAKKYSSLASICEAWGFDFISHNALEDAKACGFVTAKALSNSKHPSIHHWSFR